MVVVALLYQEIKQLDETWIDASQERLNEATLLTELERSLGYGGFIHHFKNHVLRRDEGYCEQAAAAHARASALVSEFSQTELGSRHPEQARALERTLANYGEALQRSTQTEVAGLTPAQLDQLIRVSDNDAAEALAHLRNAAGNISRTVTAETSQKVEHLRRRLLVSTGLLSPLIIVLTVFLQRSLAQSWKIAERYKRLHDGSPDGILLCDAQGRIVEASPEACRMFGYTAEEMHQLTVEALVPAHLRKAHVKDREAFTHNAQTRPMGQGINSLKGVRKDGSEVPVQISLAGQNIGGESHVMAIVRDVSHTERLRNESTTDHLTGALNRRGFESLLGQELERNARYRHGLAILLVDLDHFKRVNDTDGHAAGDEVIRRTATFLRDQCRSGDHVARWGGDEFIVLCPELELEEALQLGKRLIAEFRGRSELEFRGTSLSIGMACVSPGVHSPTQAELIAAADEALYSAKNKGRSRLRFSLIRSLARPVAVRGA
ncbi:MAG: GGDEF domain-containing protein [Planctomycetota bacterium]|jgi:diguanylate cyclase (GGDEF)-like protein/PAS domain S-box-containing protein